MRRILKNNGGEMRTEQAIGVFDSGVGGLSVLKHIREHFPNEDLIYVADSSFMPYGCKSDAVVQNRCMNIAAFFAEYPCKAMVLACNTATAVSIQYLRELYAFPIVGMEPALKPAVGQSRSGVVGILATRGTVDSYKFNQLKQRFSDGRRLIVQPCPGLVELIEQGELKGAKIRTLLQSFLNPLLQQGVDTLVLGCTHYPFVSVLIKEIVGEGITVVDTGNAIARELERHLLERQLLSKKTLSTRLGSEVFWSSGDVHAVEPLMSHLWGDVITLKKLPF